MTTRFTFSWPPPPPSPQAPQVSSPPPLPVRLTNRSDVLLECEFFEGVDLTVLGAAGPTIDRVSATKHDCCALCGRHAGCDSFVFMPDSKACLLMPPTSSEGIQKIPNPSTIGGQVRVSLPEDHVSVAHFTGCRYEAGSSYTGGALTAAAQPVASVGGHTATKQDCCDACARVPSCAKFVYEVYSGSCQLFSPIAERYYVQGLISGTMTSRNGESLGLANVSFSDFELPEVNNDDMALNYPPTPPTLLSLRQPPPSPPPDDQQLAADVLANVSLLVGTVFILMVLLCAYLIFSVQIMGWLHKVSDGKLGRPPKALMLTAVEQSAAARKASSRKLLGHKQREPGVLKVTVQTSQLSQKKEVEVGACETVAELRNLIWDEFSHLLSKLRHTDTVLLCYQADDSGANPWMLVTPASNMQRVVACEALKLVEKRLVADESFAAAFALSLKGPDDRNGEGKARQKKKAKHRRKDGRSGAKGRLDEEEAEDEPLLDGEQADPAEQADGGEEEEADWEAERAAEARAEAAERANGEERSADVDEPDSPSEPPARTRFPAMAAPLFEEGESPSVERELDPFAFSPPPIPSAPSSKARRPKPARIADDDTIIAASTLEAPSPYPPPASCAPVRTAPAAQPPTDDDDFDDMPAKSYLGKHVQIVGLVNQARLNGRIGVASTYDPSKRRYQVRLNEIDGHAEVVGLQPKNLSLV